MGAMTDLAALAFLVAFFALAVGLVKACERIIGPDVETARTETEAETSDQVAA
jgi:hypothetical protein